MNDSEEDDLKIVYDNVKKFPQYPSGSVPKACFQRQTGSGSKCLRVAKELEWAAEDIFVKKVHEEFKFQLPENSRSTFLMVFSPDGKIVASTHGNHCIYVTDVRTCKNIQTLRGHPRTPWCIAFHPSSNQILASGCLGGEVRVWDLHGGSEIWTSDCHTVIASLAFHPIERVLVIATYNELYFWDWNERTPFAKCRTGHEKEKIRYVAFDHLGHKLITGIANVSPLHSQWDRMATSSQSEHDDCLRRMLSDRYRENMNVPTSSSSHLGFPSHLPLSDRLASWNPSVRRQALAELRQPSRINFRSLSVRNDRPSSISSPNFQNIFHRDGRPSPSNLEQPTTSNLSNPRDRFSIENYFLENRDCTLNDFISYVIHQSSNRSNQSTSDGDHSYSESEQNGSVECWRMLLDFFFDEYRQNSVSRQQNEIDNEHLFTDHDYSMSREQFARSRHSWWSRHIDEGQPIDSLENGSSSAQNSNPSLRDNLRWTRAPLPPLRVRDPTSSPDSSAANEVTAPGGFRSAFYSRSISRLQWQFRRLEKMLSSLERRSSATPSHSLRSEPSSGNPNQGLHRLVPFVLMPLLFMGRIQVPTRSPGGLSRSRTAYDITDARSILRHLLSYITRPSSHQRQRNVFYLQGVFRSLYTKLADIQGAASRDFSNLTSTPNFLATLPIPPLNLSSDTSAQSVSSNLFNNRPTHITSTPRLNFYSTSSNDSRIVTQASNSLAAFSLPPLNLRSDSLSENVNNLSNNRLTNVPNISRLNSRSSSSLISDNRNPSASPTPTTSANSSLRPRHGVVLSTTERDEMLFRIKSLRRLTNPLSTDSSDQSQEPRAFQNYVHTTRPSCSGSNKASTSEEPQAKRPKLDDGKPLGYFEKLKAKFSQLSQQIKEQCVTIVKDRRSADRCDGSSCLSNESSPSVTSSDNGISNVDGPRPSSGSTNSYNETTNLPVVIHLKEPDNSNRPNKSKKNLVTTSNSPGESSSSCVSGADSSSASGGTMDSDTNNISDIVNVIDESSCCPENVSKKNDISSNLSIGNSSRVSNDSSLSGFKGDNSAEGRWAVKRKVDIYEEAIERLRKFDRTQPSTSDATSNNQLTNLSNSLSSESTAVAGSAPSAPPFNFLLESSSTETRGSENLDSSSPQQDNVAERGRVSLKRKIDALKEAFERARDNSSQSPPSTSGASTLRSNAMLKNWISTSSSSCSDSSSASSSDSDVSQDIMSEVFQNIAKVIKERNDAQKSLSLMALKNSWKTTSTPVPVSDSAAAETAPAATAEGSSSMPSSSADNVSGEPSAQRIETQLSTFIQLVVELFDDFDQRDATAQLEYFNRGLVLEDIARLIFYLTDLLLVLTERNEANQGESSQSARPLRVVASRVSLEHLQERERILTSVMSTLQRNIIQARSQDQTSSGQERAEEVGNERVNGGVSNSVGLNSDETNGECSNGFRRGSRVLRARMDAMRRSLRETIGERRTRLRQSLKDRLDENRMRRERALREIRELGGEMRESLDLMRRRLLLRETRELGRQNLHIMRLMESASSLNGDSSPLLGESRSERLRRRMEASRLSSESPSSSQQPSVSSRLSDPMLQQFNDSRPSSLSPQQRDQRNTTQNSPNSNLQRPVLCVPLVRVNDQPVSLASESNEPTQRGRPRSPPPFFTPGYHADERVAPSPHESQRVLIRNVPLVSSLDDPSLFPETPRSYFSRRSIPNELRISLHHRIQAWDFSKFTQWSSLDIKNPHKNLVVADCKIYNDASVDISSDSNLLVTLLPSSRFGFTCMLGIYSLKWETLGQRLYVVSFEQNAVSVSLSPTCRYLVVGLSARRRSSLGTDNDSVAQILRLDGGVSTCPHKSPNQSSSNYPHKRKLTEVRELELYRELSSMSLNCIRWAPTPGQGIVCGTNTGHLTFLR